MFEDFRLGCVGDICQEKPVVTAQHFLFKLKFKLRLCEMLFIFQKCPQKLESRFGNSSSNSSMISL